MKPMYERVERKFPGVFYASDDFGPYLKILPQNRHVVGKDLTYATEQHNSDTRHWLARFRRKSKVVSKSKEMIRLSLIAVEYVHKGGGLDELLQLISI